jgi:hypothetical protein
MASSNISPSLVPLVADAGDPTTEVFIIGPYFDLVAKGLGRIETELPPGIYKVQFIAGSLTKEMYITLKPDSPPHSITPSSLPFSAPAPLIDTGTTHEYHEEHAKQLSLKRHLTLGVGSQLFVFVRDLDKQGWDDPATALTLHDLAGHLLVDFTATGEREISHPNLDHWAGCTIELNPGSYRLRVQTDVKSVGTLEQIVVTHAGWQTQVFLLRRLYGYESPYEEFKSPSTSLVRRADLGNASLLMASIDRGFQPERPDFRQAELARQGLANRRNVIGASELNTMLLGKFDNPMLGIYGAHLLLAQDTDRGLLRKVISNLQGLLGYHPDVTALNVWLDETSASYPSYPSYQAPPMLSNSWKILVNASIAHPELIPTTSFAAQIADRIWGTSTWLVWQQPPENVSVPTTGPIDFTVLRDALPQITERLLLVDTPSNDPVEEVANANNLTNLERLLLEYVSSATPLKATPTAPGKSPDQLQQWGTENLTGRALVQALGVPHASITEAASGLITKMNVTRS